jgi:hypothetical protein
MSKLFRLTESWKMYSVLQPLTPAGLYVTSAGRASLYVLLADLHSAIDNGDQVQRVCLPIAAIHTIGLMELGVQMPAANGIWNLF